MRENPHGPQVRTIRFTLLTNDGGRPLSKHIHLQKNGKTKKLTGASLSVGSIAEKQVKSLRELARTMCLLPPNSAATFGVPKRNANVVLSEKNMKTYQGAKEAITRTRENFVWPEGPGVLCLDYDPQPGKDILTGTEFVKALRNAVPELKHVTVCIKPSTSSYIYRGQEQIDGIKGLHGFLVCSDAKRIPEIGKLIHDRLWLAGLGYIRIAENGAMLERSIVDTAVWQPERLIFGRAECEDGLEQHFPEPAIFPAALEALEQEEQWLTPNDLPTLSPKEQVRLASMIVAAKDEKTAESKARRKKWIEKWVKEALGKKASAEEIEKTKEAFRRSLDEGDVLPDQLMLRTHHGGKVSVGEIRANPDKWHGQRFADPFEPGYGGGDSRIAVAYLKDCVEPLIYSHAHGGLKYYFRPKGERNNFLPDYASALKCRASGYLRDNGH